jgi:hypothetical protein
VELDPTAESRELGREWTGTATSLPLEREPAPRAEAPGPAALETQRWSELERQIAAVRIAIERGQREANRNLWTVALLCMGLALGVAWVETAIYPRPSLEDRELQRLGAYVQERWQTLKEKERRQVEQILGWSRSTGPHAQ